MGTLEALWLGLVQGLTEFLPVSSSGHLVMARTLMGLEPGAEGEGLVLEVALHVATLVAIVLFYARRIGEILRGLWARDPQAWRYVGKIALATLPAVGVGLFLADFVEEQFAAPRVAGICLLGTGALLFTTRWTLPRAQRNEPGFVAALGIGIAQAVAILPGISRSGTTVAVALALGVAPLAAAEFSFLMGIVAIAGAAVLMLRDLGSASPELLSAIAVGGTAALVSGIAALWLFVQLLRSQRFHWFASYAWVVGTMFLLWLGWAR